MSLNHKPSLASCHASWGAGTAISLLLPKCPLCIMVLSGPLFAGPLFTRWLVNWFVAVLATSTFAFGIWKLSHTFDLPYPKFLRKPVLIAIAVVLGFLCLWNWKLRLALWLCAVCAFLVLLCTRRSQVLSAVACQSTEAPHDSIAHLTTRNLAPKSL